MPDESSAFAKLGELISDKEFRESIRTNFRAAAKDAGLDVSQIPKEVLDTLGDLSKAELAVLARVKKRLIDAKVDPKYGSDLV
jgi:hypothetical protein